MREVEILASSFDAGTDAWYPEEGTDPLSDAGPTAIVVGECVQDVAILHNAFVGWSTAVRVEANGHGVTPATEGPMPCNGLDVDGVRIEGNLVRDSSDRLVGSTVPWVLQTSHPDEDVGDDRTIRAVQIVDNVVQVDEGLLGCAWVQIWGADAGPIAIDHDTCIGAIQTSVPAPDAALVRVSAPRTGGVDPLADLAVRGQLFAGQNAGDVALALESPPAAWLADHNAFSPGAAFRWQADGPTDLAGWQAASVQDAASVACAPSFFADGDFHLGEDDTCASGIAAPIEGAAYEYDFDGDPRPAEGPWDAGADQRP
jgi:hypothetical protein